MSIRDKIKSTNEYKRMDNLQQKLIFGKKNIEDIKLGLNMSELTTFNNWVKVTSPRDKVKNIVREILYP